MPVPPTKRQRRRCALCGIPELTEAEQGRFLLVPDSKGRGPVCPPQKGCTDRQRQLQLLEVAQQP